MMRFDVVPRRGALTMMLRGTAAVVLIFVQTAGASAGERTAGLMHRVSCTLVRYYVGKYSETAAEAWARGKGATDADIEAARRCLAGSGSGGSGLGGSGLGGSGLGGSGLGGSGLAGSTQTLQAAAWH
jgi:hypothetical protein